MVHRWISLCNDRIDATCQNKRILRIFQNKEVSFYGDYNLVIYLGTKNDYSSLDAFVSKLIISEGGWISEIQMKDAEISKMDRLEQYMALCGWIPHKEFKKMFPRREESNNYEIIKGFKLLDDGNFKKYVCETHRFYYAICFVTS
jgi:hypothetical protein